ncbi:carbonic anhydrase [Nitrosomonas supralitoralis]|uniref:Carbonic anhydrase n=1 Tax=Nitrosomonas supralitoralis TaxID=2116706 RepID=A0A2P7NR58_9PROT|nr:carbonic anhydrase [Nitrosomonas supralitoralis]PSJ15953.1 carbonic anhydrase [Nitrosomonas supralitoralis]
MCYIFNQKDENLQHDLRKRSFLKIALAGTLGLGMFGGGIVMASEKKPLQTASSKVVPEPENVLTPEKALERLMEGNKRHEAGLSIESPHKHTPKDAHMKGQNPYAAILGCADSRVGPEHCFDESHGDLFVARVAGNYITIDFLATLEYAVSVLHTPLIMVLGHEKCGAVKAAMDSINKNEQFEGHIQTMATALLPAVRAAKKIPGELYDNTVIMNVKLAVAELKKSTPIFNQLVKDKKLLIVGGVYRIGTGRVVLVT